MKIPPYLESGDKVAVVATAKRLEKSIEKGLKLISQWGFEVTQGEHLNATSEYFAGTDEERIGDLQSALDDKSIKAIVFARGGYGTTKILDRLDWTKFQKSPKWLIGFSDLTSILLHSNQLGIPSIHGPVCMTLGRDSSSDSHLLAMLKGEARFEFPLQASDLTKSGSCQGKLIGGNLSLICESIGADNELDTQGNILFLEEVGEEKYAVDRMMTKLKRCGKLENLSGVILGDFTQIGDKQDYFLRDIETIVLEYFYQRRIPIAVGFSGGHEKQNLPLMMGREAKVDIEKNKVTLSYG